MAFSLILTFQYLNEFLSSDKGQGMKNILNFSNFPKIFEKGHDAPSTHPNLQMEILNISKFSFAGLGALGVRQALFSIIFGRFESFNTFIVP